MDRYVIGELFSVLGVVLALYGFTFWISGIIPLLAFAVIIIVAILIVVIPLCIVK